MGAGLSLGAGATALAVLAFAPSSFADEPGGAAPEQAPATAPPAASSAPPREAPAPAASTPPAPAHATPAPPATSPPATSPPATQPPATQPPATQPPYPYPPAYPYQPAYPYPPAYPPPGYPYPPAYPPPAYPYPPSQPYPYAPAQGYGSPPPDIAARREAQRPTERRWYGWQMLPADVASIIMFTGDESTQLLGAVLFTFGGPVVHFAHSEALRGGGSLAIRILSPLFFIRIKGDGPEAAMLAAAVAGATDMAALAWERVPVERNERKLAVRLAPRIALGDRRASVGLAGQF